MNAYVKTKGSGGREKKRDCSSQKASLPPTPPPCWTRNTERKTTNSVTPECHQDGLDLSHLLLPHVLIMWDGCWQRGNHSPNTHAYNWKWRQRVSIPLLSVQQIAKCWLNTLTETRVPHHSDISVISLQFTRAYYCFALFDVLPMLRETMKGGKKEKSVFQLPNHLPQNAPMHQHWFHYLPAARYFI